VEKARQLQRIIEMVKKYSRGAPQAPPVLGVTRQGSAFAELDRVPAPSLLIAEPIVPLAPSEPSIVNR